MMAEGYREMAEEDRSRLMPPWLLKERSFDEGFPTKRGDLVDQLESGSGKVLSLFSALCSITILAGGSKVETGTILDRKIF
jgi:hypothetical protein